MKEGGEAARIGAVVMGGIALRISAEGNSVNVCIPWGAGDGIFWRASSGRPPRPRALSGQCVEAFREGRKGGDCLRRFLPLGSAGSTALRPGDGRVDQGRRRRAPGHRCPSGVREGRKGGDCLRRFLPLGGQVAPSSAACFSARASAVPDSRRCLIRFVWAAKGLDTPLG